MATRSARMLRWKENILRVVVAFSRRLTEPSISVEPKQRRRIRLLSAFLILMALNTVAGSISLKNISGNSWAVMLATSATLLCGYFVSRTRYYRVALILAIIVPAIPPLAIAVFKAPEIDLTAELMWLAMPLLVSSLMLTVRQTITLAFSYIAFIIILELFGSLGFEILAPLMAYILIITLFVVAVAAVRRIDQSEIENQLTERLQVEKALRESEEKFSIAFHSSPEMIIITDTTEGKYIDVNDSFVQNTGYTREELVGHRIGEFNLWVEPAEADKFTQTLQEQGKVRHGEFKFRRKTGEIRTWLCSADVLSIDGEKRMLAVATDITKRKQAENKLKEAMTNLKHSSVLLKATNKELESFSYSVSHDLQSPLRSIDGFSQALLEDYANKLDETGKDYLNRLRGASQKMGELIDGLLKLSRLTRSEMHLENVNLSALAEEISIRLQETHPNSRAKFVIDSGLSADGDPQMLRVLLENLLGNAWKFTRKTPQARIEFGSTTNGAGKTFFIKDNGAGFDMAYKDNLFGAFQRLHNTADFPGTGIGLATVQRIINRHGGSIHAEGAVGKGAIFYFTLS